MPLPNLALAQRRFTATINIDTSRPLNRFTPSHALGAAIDGHEKGVNNLQLKRDNIKLMLSAGLKPLTYRLRTELGMDVWHWNPRGSWSDQKRREGYWISDSNLGAPISLSYGYSLPRRGNTIDQAANEGYSRLDDGDPRSFWKSNPYLDAHFTGEDNKLHPQWIVIEFTKRELINAIRVIWGEPFAKRFRVQYGNFDDPSVIALSPPGTWSDFPVSEFEGHSDKRASQDRILRLAPKPISTRMIRIIFTESSGLTRSASSDIRDRLGFAVRELYAGAIDDGGQFHDQIRHGMNRFNQTIIHVSSTDPWHRQIDRDDEIEQVGLDRIYESGLTDDLPMLLPTGLIYDTPENSANGIRYLRARGYKFNQVELGEEPDGQYITPEDFGALYLQWASAIHRVDPHLQIGGPSFQEILPSPRRPYPIDNAEWMRRFLGYLQARNRLDDFNFFSFEWYPFDDVCDPVAPQLALARAMLDQALRELERRGNVPRNIPWIISEYGYSAYASRAEIDIEGALFHADIVGAFLTLGGDQAYLYGYAPDVVLEERTCTAGNNMLFSMDDEGNIQHKLATYFAARLLTQEWLKPGDEAHEIYAATSAAKDADGNELVSVYPVKRPDGFWSLLFINKDPKQSFNFNLSFQNSARMKPPIDVYQYSATQYALGGSMRNPYPIRAEDPSHRVLESVNDFILPPYSLTVVRAELSQ
ncbi:MAG TPA: discoidin domain-containing protein [Pyrinomonadaceae bacterium]|nr:discoidin domain-containing protein [Pyrinomonadaceae bacterium]